MPVWGNILPARPWSRRPVDLRLCTVFWWSHLLPGSFSSFNRSKLVRFRWKFFDLFRELFPALQHLPGGNPEPVSSSKWRTKRAQIQTRLRWFLQQKPKPKQKKKSRPLTSHARCFPGELVIPNEVRRHSPEKQHTKKRWNSHGNKQRAAERAAKQQARLNVLRRRRRLARVRQPDPGRQFWFGYISLGPPARRDLGLGRRADRLWQGESWWLVGRRTRR